MTARLALFGDVHANLTALAAVLEAIRRGGITAGVCTGDLVMRGAHPDECVATVAALGWPGAAGNTDRKMVDKPAPPPTHRKAGLAGSRAWTRLRLSESSLRYLAGMPDVARASVAGRRVAVVHVGPDPGAPDAELAALAARLHADCVVTGHTHVPWVRRVGPHLFVNPGSVGEGVAGDRRPAWAWLEGGPDGVEAHLERLDAPLAHVRSG